MKLASIERISSIEPHPNADRLELAHVLGFQCVVAKGQFATDDVVVFIQPDSVLPPDEAWSQTYLQYAPKRVKAIKLRDWWSEGLIVGYTGVALVLDEALFEDMSIGVEVSELLNITKYEPPIPSNVEAKGGLSLGIPKTDAERWENLKNIPFGELCDVTLKIDGQSWSAFYDIDTDRFGVCGRSFECKLECENKYTAHAVKYNIEEKLKKYCKKHKVSLCIRGESYGAGIQKSPINPHCKLGSGLALFSVWNIRERRYENKGDPHYFVRAAYEMCLPHVDVLDADVPLTQELITYYSESTNQVNGLPFEGVVINTSKGIFKIINKYYDSKK